MKTIIMIFVLFLTALNIHCQQQGGTSGSGGGVQISTVRQIAGDSSQVAETRAKNYTNAQFNANPKSWRTQAQAKQDAIDTLRNLELVNNPADQNYIVVETASGLKKSQIYNIPQETRIQQLQSLINQLQVRVAQLEEALQDTTAPTIQVPVAPSNLRYFTTTTYISLDWQDNSTNETGFQILRKISGSMNYAPLDTVPSNITTYSDSNVTQGTYYDYAVKALGQYGNSGTIEVTNVRLSTVDYKLTINPPSLYRELDSVAASPSGNVYIMDAESGDLTGFTNFVYGDSSILYVTNSNPINGNYSYRFSAKSSNASSVVEYSRYYKTFPDSVYLSYKIKLDSIEMNGNSSIDYIGLYNANFFIFLLSFYRNSAGVGTATHFAFDGTIVPFSSVGYNIGDVADITIYYYEGSQTDSIATLKAWINGNLVVNKTKKIGVGWGTITNYRIGNLFTNLYNLAYSIDDIRFADVPPGYSPSNDYEFVPITLKNNSPSSVTITSFEISPSGIFSKDPAQNYLVSVASGDSITRNIRILKATYSGQYNATATIITDLDAQTYSMSVLIRGSSQEPPPIQTNRWYVYKNASGLNNGTSWTNAWTSFSAINWNNIQPGDTIFISGGTDSLIYSEKLTVSEKNGAPNQYITITKGKDTGHNGKVIINGGYSIANVVSILGSKYIKLSKLKVTYGSIAVYDLYNSVSSRHIIIDSVEIYNHFGTGIALGGYPTPGLVDSIFITNSRIVRDSTYNAQTDNISVGYGTNIFIRNNYFYLNNNSNGHNDNIQAYQTNYNIEISGNYIEHIQPTSPVTGWADNVVFLNYVRGWVKFFNNILNYETATGGFNIFGHGVENAADYGQTHIYNNTFIGGTSGLNVICLIPSTADSFYLQNNIFYSTAATNTQLFTLPSTVPASQCRNNLYYNPNSQHFYKIGGNTYTIPQLQSLGYEQESMFGVPQFVDFTNKDYRLQSSSPARNAGTNLSSFFTTDKNGVSRPQESVWDIGAYEYVP